MTIDFQPISAWQQINPFMQKRQALLATTVELTYGTIP